MTEKQTDKEITAFTYNYRCQGLFYPWTGTRNFIHTDGKNPVSEAEEDAKMATGSGQCSIALLQKFYMTVRLGEPYPALLQFREHLR